MHNPSEIEVNGTKLSAILKLHQKWFEGKKGGKRADLSYANLSNANLRGADLSGADLSGADLRGADRWDSVQSEYVAVTDEWVRKKGAIR